MKTFTAQADAARSRRYAEPIYLLELRLYRDQFGPTPVSTTLYLSDRTRTELGQTWLPLVQSWGTVGDALDQLGPGGSIGALDVVLFNTKTHRHADGERRPVLGSHPRRPERRRPDL